MDVQSSASGVGTVDLDSSQRAGIFRNACLNDEKQIPGTPRGVRGDKKGNEKEIQRDKKGNERERERER